MQSDKEAGRSMLDMTTGYAGRKRSGGKCTAAQILQNVMAAFRGKGSRRRIVKRRRSGAMDGVSLGASGEPWTQSS
jgi:hypothetical protein